MCARLHFSCFRSSNPPQKWITRFFNSSFCFRNDRSLGRDHILSFTMATRTNYTSLIWSDVFSSLSYFFLFCILFFFFSATSPTSQLNHNLLHFRTMWLSTWIRVTIVYWPVLQQFALLLLLGCVRSSCSAPPAKPHNFAVGLTSHLSLTTYGAGAMGSIILYQPKSRFVLLVCVLSRMRTYVTAHHPTTTTSQPPLLSPRRPAICRYKSIYSTWWRVSLTRHRKSKIYVT